MTWHQGKTSHLAVNSESFSSIYNLMFELYNITLQPCHASPPYSCQLLLFKEIEAGIIQWKEPTPNHWTVLPLSFFREFVKAIFWLSTLPATKMNGSILFVQFLRYYYVAIVCRTASLSFMVASELGFYSQLLCRLPSSKLQKQNSCAIHSITHLFPKIESISNHVILFILCF